MAQEPFGDIPLFREIQRILSSSEGPVNLEIGRQVAVALATEGMSDTNVGPDKARALQQVVGDAERLVAGYTRMTFDEPLQAEAVGRAAWVDGTLKSWRWLLEHLGGHFTAELTRSQSESAAGEGEMDAMQGAMGQIAPLLIGVQAGTLIGHLARAALGRYDWPIPREDSGKLFFVLPNLEKLASEYSLKEETVIAWMGVHETARHIVLTSQPWIGRYLRSLLLEVVDATEIDMSDLERKLMELQTKGMEGLQDGMGSQNQLPVVSTERHRKALERLKAFVAALEGYGAHVEKAVTTELFEGAERVREGVARFRAGHGDADAMLGSVLGIGIERELEDSGATFCAAITSLHGLPSLNKVWDAPDNLPTLAEIKDPFAWMERVLAE